MEMKKEQFDEKMFEECKNKYELIPTIPQKIQDIQCPDCKTVCISMILDETPSTGPGTMPMCHLYGCPNCKTISYEKPVFEAFVGKKCSLKDYLIETGRIENIE